MIGDPRLVRLNPNVPFKTRGNGALAVRLGRGAGRSRVIGELEGREVRAFDRGRELSAREQQAVFDAAWGAVANASAEGERTEPALAATLGGLPSGFYRRAVRTLVPLEDARSLLTSRRARYRTRGSDQGLVGAAAAIAWPGRRATWELLAYRRPERVGRPRRISAASVRAAQARDRRLFLCYDPRTRRLLVAPHTRCPILFGLRATSRRALVPAARSLRSEPVDRWLVFRTNQGTGDHVREAQRIADLGPYSAGRFRGRVSGPPVTLRGGHVQFSISDDTGATLPCVAFEPTKTLPAVARSLVMGDRIEVWGGRGADPTFRLEGIVLPRRGRRARGRAPTCPRCGVVARSLGRSRGFRCRRCHRRWPPEARSAIARAPSPAPGTYHPTPSARRHLAPRGPENVGE